MPESGAGASTGRVPAAVPAAELPGFIEQFISDYLADPETNNLGPGWPEPAWQDFILAYSSGADPLYDFFKEHIGEFHWTPAEAFALGRGAEAQERRVAAYADADDGSTPPPDQLTVVSWAISQTDATKADNRKQTTLPAERWARARYYGQNHNRALHKRLVTALAARGYSAVAPAMLPEHGDFETEEWGRASRYSERHVAYTSGLGTFGLSGGLITSLGQAIRLGSVVVRARLPVTERPYSGPFDYCLFFNGGKCTACLDRCPVDALRLEGVRDKAACAEHLHATTRDYVLGNFGFKGYGCGMCQTGVPCESRIPVR